MSHEDLAVLEALCTYLTTATAGLINVMLMRGAELGSGIKIFDPNNGKKEVAISKSAARKAIL